MVEKTQVNLQVNESQKARWEDYKDETGQFSTLSDLIRTSVETEIKRDEQDEETASPALANDVSDLKDELTEVRTDVAWLRKQLQDEVDVSDLAQEVFDLLEPLPSPSGPVEVPESIELDAGEYKRYLGAQAVIEPSGDDHERSPQTANALATRVGSQPKRVEDAIDHLQDQFLPVIEVEYQGQVHYFKEA